MPPLARPLADRFWPKVRKTAGCWLWTASIRRDGYGQIRGPEGQNLSAHRLAYVWLVGPIPVGLQLDHLCRVRRCVNPAHLEPVTHRENSLRGTGAPARNAVKTFCLRGHPLSGDNVRVQSSGWRRCRACERIYDAARTTVASRKAGAAFLL